MKYSKTITLKNGSECVIRNADGSDAQAVIDSFILTHAQTDYLLTYPDENSADIEKERKFLSDKADSDCEIELCAVIDGKIVGTAGIDAIGKKEKIKHRAEYGISIEKDYWGLGIGYEMTAACIKCAKVAGYSQLELDVVSDNKAAVALYRKAGFTEYGRNPRGFRSRTAGWQELILMRKELD